MVFKFSPSAFDSLDFGLKPIDLSNLGSQSLTLNAPLSQADLVASASRAASSPLLNVSTPTVTAPVDFTAYGPPSPTTSTANIVGNTSGLSPLRLVTTDEYAASRPGGVETITINPRGALPTINIDGSSTAQDKANEYNNLINQGFTDAQIRDQANTQFGTQSDADWSYLQNLAAATSGFVGPVSPGSAKPSRAVVSDLTLTPDFVRRATAEDQVKSAFQDVLGRQPLPGPGQGLEYWTNELLSGRVSLADLEGAIARGAQGGDRLAANQFLGTDFFKVSDPSTAPYKSLLGLDATVSTEPSIVEQYNTKAAERIEEDKPVFTSWEELPNVDEAEIQAAQDAGYVSPMAYFLAKVDSTDPELAPWREETRDRIFNNRSFRRQFGDLFAKPMDQDAVQHIYGQLKDQYELASEQGYKYKFESDIDEILESEAAKLVAGGVTDLYQIGTRETPQFETFNNVHKIGNDYYTIDYESETGNEIKTKIDPSTITEIKERAIPVFDSESNGFLEDEIQYDITVDKGPVTELINKFTGDPLYDASLKGDWRTNPMGYELRNRNGRIILDVEPREGGYGRIHWNTGVRDQADMMFMQTADGLPIVLPVWKSTKDTSWMMPVAMFASAFIGPYATQLGASLGATTAAGQAMLGTGVINVGTQLVLNDGKINLDSLVLSVGTAGLAANAGWTGSDIAADATSMAEAGLQAPQIAENLQAIGVNPVTAELSANFAAAGIPQSIAPAITSGVTNMGLTALVTLAGENPLDADALVDSFATGAAGGVSEVAVQDIIGADRIAEIAKDLNLTPDQALSVATQALATGINAEVLDRGEFFDEFAQTLVVNGASFATANKVADSLKDSIGPKGVSAFATAARDIVKVAGNAAWDNLDPATAVETMAPVIIGNSLSAYTRTPDTTVKQDKVAELEGVEVAGIVTRGTMDALKTKALIGETVTDTQVDDQGYTKKTITGVDNNGKEYSYSITYDDKGDVSYTWQDQAGETQISRVRPDLKGTEEVPGATDSSQIDVENKDDNESVARYISDKFFNGAFSDVDAEDIPIIGGLIKSAAEAQGAGFDGLGNQLQKFSSSWSLINGSPFEGTVRDLGDDLIYFGKELGSENYIERSKDFQKDYLQVATQPRPDGLAKSPFNRISDWVSVAKDNPIGATNSFMYEVGQETLPIVAAGTTLLMVPAAIPTAGAVGLATLAGSLVDAYEVFGDSGEKGYRYGLSIGESDEAARTRGIIEGASNSMITLFTEAAGDKALIGLYASGLKTSIALGLGAAKSIVANFGSEYAESLGHTYNIAAQRGQTVDANYARAGSMLEAVIGKHTAGVLVSPAVVTSVAIGVNENGEDITLEDIRSGNENLAAPKMDAPVNITESGDSLTLGGVTAIMKQNDVPVDFELTPDTPVFEKADGTVVTFDDLQFESSINDESFAEVITRLSDNQIVIPAEFNNPISITPPSQDANIISAAKAGSITIDSSQDVDPDTGVTVTETVDVPQSQDVNIDPSVKPDLNKNIDIDPDVKPDIDPDVKPDIKTDPAIETTTVSNPETDQETKIEVVTDPDNNITQVVATEINGPIKVDVSEPYNEIIQELIDEGNTPEEAKEKAKVPVKNAVSKGSSLNAFAPPFGASKIDDIVNEFRNLRTTGKRKFESPLEAFLRKSRGEPEVEAEKVTAEKKEPTMDYYSYGKPSEIDEILGTVEEYGVGPNVQFPELGQMAPQFAMRRGGLVPAFADGGPLTMAAGKLRRDYREGDAVEGPGDGQSDDIPAMLADGEFVIPADVVAALGNGSNKAGADKLYEMMHNIRRDYRKAKPKDLPKPAKSPLSYISRRT